MSNNTINTLMIVIPLILLFGYAALVVRFSEQASDLVNKYGVAEFESRRQRHSFQGRFAAIYLLGIVIVPPSVFSFLLGCVFMGTMKPN